VTTVILTTNSGNGLGIFIACLFSDLRYPASRTSPTPEAVPVCHSSSFFCSQSLSFFSWPCLVWPLSLLSWWFRCVRCLSQPRQPHTGALTLWSSTRGARRLTRQQAASAPHACRDKWCHVRTNGVMSGRRGVISGRSGVTCRTRLLVSMLW